MFESAFGAADSTAMTRASLSLIAALALAGLASSVLLARPAPPSKASVRAAILDAVYN